MSRGGREIVVVKENGVEIGEIPLDEVPVGGAPLSSLVLRPVSTRPYDADARSSANRSPRPNSAYGGPPPGSAYGPGRSPDSVFKRPEGSVREGRSVAPRDEEDWDRDTDQEFPKRSQRDFKRLICCCDGTFQAPSRESSSHFLPFRIV